MKMKIKLRYLVLLILCQTFIWSCEDNPFEPDDVTEVAIRNGQFSPSSVTVSVGTTVRWTNKDSEVRFVGSGTPMNPTNDFNSPNLETNDSFDHTFNGVGTFPYYETATNAAGSVIVTN